MSHIVIWIIAYLLTGLSYVTRDANEPVSNQPSALQTTGGAVAMLMIWPLIALAFSKARAFSHTVLFAIFGGIGEVVRLVR
jgi:hypothetical protein